MIMMLIIRKLSIHRTNVRRMKISFDKKRDYIKMITEIIIILFRLLAENPSLLNLFPKYEHLNTERDRNNDEAFQVKY